LFPVKDERKTSRLKHTAIFLQVLDVKKEDGKEYVYFKFTYDRQTMAKKWKDKGGGQTRGLDYHDWSTKDSSTETKYLYYGIMRNTWDSGRIAIVYCNIRDKSTPVVNIWGEPQSGIKYNFIIDDNSSKNLPNSTYDTKKALVKISKLQRFDANGVGSDIKQKDLICFNEKKDDEIPMIDFCDQNGKPTQDNLNQKLIKQGKTWGFW